MTDARISERYLLDRRVARLSDSAFRAWVTATLWSVANRTDGRVDALDLPLIPRLDANAADDLVDAKLWTAVDGGWVIEGFQDEQTSRSELQALDDARRHARERKRAQRERERNTPADGESRDGHVTNSVTSHGTTQDRTRTGSQSPTDTAGERKSVSPALVTARESGEVSSAARAALGSDILADALGDAGWATLRDEIAEKSSETVRDRQAYALRALTADDRAAWIVRAWDIAGTTPPPREHVHLWLKDGSCNRPIDGAPDCLARREEVTA